MSSAAEPSTSFRNTVVYGDASTVLRTIPSGIAQTCVTSPPYFSQRSYLPRDHRDKHLELGCEAMPEEYVERVVAVLAQVRRVLRDDGTAWVVIGDTFWNQSPIRSNGADAWEKAYTGGTIRDGRRRSTKGHAYLKEKDLVGVPSLLAHGLQADGWWLRSDIIWSKGATTPEPSAVDRPWSAHEHILLLAKQADYFFDGRALREERTTNGGRTVWTLSPSRGRIGHPAAFPPELASICIKAGSRPGDVVLDPFTGSGTTLAEAAELDRTYLGVELNEAYRTVIDDRVGPASERARMRAGLQAIGL